jgi:hypothetical protein
MTTYAENQFVAVGFPKGGLTPATITAMVGFSLGEGLQMSPMVTAALDKIKGATSATIAGLPAGAATALSNVGITMDTINASTDPAQAVQGIKDALATDGIMLDTATENSLTSTIGLTSKMQSLSSKIMAGGPAAFMSKFNAARGHIADAVELKKVTAFTANQTLESFGSGMKKMSSLSSNGLDGVVGNMKAAAAAMLSAGPLADLTDPGSMGGPVGLIKKLADSKMANGATGITEKLGKIGIKLDDISNPANLDKVKKVMGSISDPKAIKDVADQFGANPPGGLPAVGKQSFAAATNLFAKLPSYSGPDSSLNTDAAATLLSGTSSPNDPPPPIGPAPVEPSADPVKWTEVNTLSSNPATSKQEQIDAIDQQMQDLSTEFRNNFSTPFTAAVEEYVNASYALDFGKAGVKAERQALSDIAKDKVEPAYHGAFAKAKELEILQDQLPKKSPEWYKWNELRKILNNILDVMSASRKNLVDVRKDILAKIEAAGGS